jgi:hypothetical protein
VIEVPSSRRDTAAYARRIAATTTRPELSMCHLFRRDRRTHRTQASDVTLV